MKKRFRKKMDKIFKNPTLFKCLLFLTRYEEGTCGEIAQVFKISKSTVYKAILQLEEQDVIVGRSISIIRLYSYNPRFALKKELRDLCEKYLELYMPFEKNKDFYSIRRRPRRTGKRLL